MPFWCSPPKELTETILRLPGWQKLIGVVAIQEQDCEVTYLHVASFWRGMGYGSKLLQSAEQALREAGCERARLITVYSAKGFYRKQGYYSLDEGSCRLYKNLFEDG